MPLALELARPAPAAAGGVSWTIEMKRGSLILFAMTAVSCGASNPNVRRPLVTDQTPLGTDSRAVMRWFGSHGWCFAEPEDARVRARLCDHDQPAVSALLTFRDDVLAQVDVLVPVGPARTGAPMPYRAGSPGSPDLVERRDDDAGALVDALAHELEARYGKPSAAGGPGLTWTTDRERIVLYLEWNRRWIIERHARVSDPPAEVNPRITEAW